MNANKKNDDENNINKKYRTDFNIEESITKNYDKLIEEK